MRVLGGFHVAIREPPHITGGSDAQPSPEMAAAREANDMNNAAERSAKEIIETGAAADAVASFEADDAVRAADGPDVRGAAASPEAVTMDPSVSCRWIKVNFARRGLAFMLDHPVAAIRTEIGNLIAGLIAVIIMMAIGFAIIFVDGVNQLSPMVGQTDHITHHKNTWHEVFVVSAYGALIFVVLAALIFVVPAVRSTLREWSAVGNSMALMLAFIGVYFLSADSWHLTGAIPWWRLRTFVVVFLLFSLAMLYRQAIHIINNILRSPIKADDLTDSIKDPLVKKLLSNSAYWKPQIPLRARINLGVVAAILLARRILISGIIVSAALFILGIILIGEQDTFVLMNSHSPAVIGFTANFGIGKYQFFVSESLLKVCLALGGIAAAFFVFATPDQDKSQDTLVPIFIRKIIALWACYQLLTGTADPLFPDHASEPANSSDEK